MRSISINPLIWQLASEEKIKLIKSRVNLFRDEIIVPLTNAVEEGELDASAKEVTELVQAINFILSGAISETESQLLNNQHKSSLSETFYRHISKTMSFYRWQTPLTREHYEHLMALVASYYNTHKSTFNNCQNCRLSQQGAGCVGTAKSLSKRHQLL
ncbi:hypothetical protein [Paraferrimonas haliotis]|uniref:hypothetical protein n=1 Tax=Paraferrimonas haliotis TaxID=2013866 RepID=UPI000F76960D|nr:hypothetical protein [Paraferrimonas haliotis]